MDPFNPVTFSDDEMLKINYVYQLARTVRILSVIDIICAFFYLFYNPYLLFASFVNLLICYTAYIGTKEFSTCKIIPYIILNILKNMANCYLIIKFWDEVNIVLFESFLLLLGSYITYIIIKFYIKLSGLTLEHVNFLKTIENRQYVLTFI